MTISVMTPAQREELAVDLASLSTDGLDIPPLQPLYMIRYWASLIGRQYKQMPQVIVQVIHKYVDTSYVAMWKAIAPLCVLCWYPKIMARETYLVWSTSLYLLQHYNLNFSDSAPHSHLQHSRHLHHH
jgi:hypothetical protein